MAVAIKWLSVALVVGGAATYLLWRASSDAPASGAGRQREPPAETARDAREALPARARPAREARHASLARADERRKPADLVDEPALMQRLRQLVSSDPEAALALAQQGDARFGESPDAAERTYHGVRALVNLGDFHEARDRALLMKQRYPGTPWALEVERHLLVYPLDMPSREEMQAAAAEVP